MAKVKKMRFGGIGRAQRSPAQPPPPPPPSRGMLPVSSSTHPSLSAQNVIKNVPLGPPPGMQPGLRGVSSPVSYAPPAGSAPGILPGSIPPVNTPPGALQVAAPIPVMKKGGKVKASSASKRADGIAKRGKTKGRVV